MRVLVLGRILVQYIGEFCSLANLKRFSEPWCRAYRFCWVVMLSFSPTISATPISQANSSQPDLPALFGAMLFGAVLSGLYFSRKVGKKHDKGAQSSRRRARPAKQAESGWLDIEAVGSNMQRKSDSVRRAKIEELVGQELGDDLDFEFHFTRLANEGDFEFAKQLLDIAHRHAIDSQLYHLYRLKLLAMQDREDQFYDYYYSIEDLIPRFNRKIQTEISKLVVILSQQSA